MTKIYYEKIGRKYVPVAEYNEEWLDSFTRGNHLVMSYPGGSSRRYNIDPAFAPMIAAGRVARDAIRGAMYGASEAKPSKKPITARQRKAWKEMQAAFGDELYSLEFASIVDIAEAGVAAMQTEADKLLSNPAVKLAYDHFLMVCELSKVKQD